MTTNAEKLRECLIAERDRLAKEMARLSDDIQAVERVLRIYDGEPQIEKPARHVSWADRKERIREQAVSDAVSGVVPERKRGRPRLTPEEREARRDELNLRELEDRVTLEASKAPVDKDDPPVSVRPSIEEMQKLYGVD